MASLTNSSGVLCMPMVMKLLLFTALAFVSPGGGVPEVSGYEVLSLRAVGGKGRSAG